MYRKSDWERIGGYCEEIIAREDWEFWISMLKDGGEVRKLPYIALHYRVREGSKRVTDRALKKHVIAVLNRRHPEFFHRFDAEMQNEYTKVTDTELLYEKPMEYGLPMLFSCTKNMLTGEFQQVEPRSY